ncbi:MAG TPA: matrixin family metalloprotease [Vicinamibacterales bacterium]|nr:matrixin family metalloprotease [Vicinamibacterales bacterium]
MRTRARPPAVAIVVVGLAWSAPAHAYLKLGAVVEEETVALKWRAGTISYFVVNAGVPNVSAAEFQAAVQRAFDAWNAVETAEVDVQFAGFTNLQPFETDDVSVIGFRQREDLERVLASTGFSYLVSTGELVEADIFFNSRFPWTTASEGQPGRFDIQSIATHEAGHFLGLGHSALGETVREGGGRRVIAAEAVMFPIAFSPGGTNERRLRADDIAGISDLYPSSDFRRITGSIQGRVSRSGRPIFGAHVVAFNLETGELVGGFTLEDNGGFVIAGLSPGLHVLRAEPLDDGELESFFDGVTPEDLNFRPTFHDRLVVVPAGGSSERVEISVGAR